MKAILYRLLLVILVFAVYGCKKIELFNTAYEKITIEGIVSDANNNLLDSVEIVLYKDDLFSPDIYIYWCNI